MMSLRILAVTAAVTALAACTSPTGLIDVATSPAEDRSFADSTAVVPRPLRFPDADFFLVHKQREDAGLYIGKPLRVESDGRWVIPLSRRLAYADGAFAGVVVGSYVRGQKPLLLSPTTSARAVRLRRLAAAASPWGSRLGPPGSTRATSEG